ncbi:MAG TPA: energy transducer TonB [Lacunisphaera sp.]|nr:energy transducer TonB [Lacunisphaera sp.]
MNARSPLLSALLLALATAPAFAALESIQVRTGNDLPPFPPRLIVDGVTSGHAVVAVSVNAEGKMDDCLVLGYSDERLARSAVDALKRWRFVPARLDGQPVRAQTELRFDFSVEGAVISSNLTERFIANLADGRFARLADHRPSRPRELDRVPAKIAGAAPRYATSALKEGVRGSVEVHFYIDEKGEVRLPCVDAGSHPYLMEQAVEAVRDWKFEPPTSRGRPVLVAAAQKFEFGDGN